jgi:endonuclease/exonuclease/phosphatase (EEP) superfamily protein YafD
MLLALTNIFAPYMFTPLLPLLPLALWWRAWRLLLASMLLLLLAAGLFVPDMMPRLPRPAVQPDVRVLTLNMRYDNPDVPGAVEMLMAQDADIIALQELQEPMIPIFEQYRDQYPYQRLNPRETPGGLGILSRYPLEPLEILEGVRGVQTVVTVEGRPITLIVAHPFVPRGAMTLHVPFTDINKEVPTFEPTLRNVQLENLIDHVARTEGPLLLMGDLNTADREPVFQPFDVLLRDAYNEAGWGMGYTYSNTALGLGHAYAPLLPRVRIDYILSSSDIIPLAAHVNCTATGSDHCMVIAELGWK